MTRPGAFLASLLLDDANERQGLFHRRAFLFGGVAVASLTALTGRLVQLQMLEAGRYKMLSEHNRFQFLLTAPPRGLILDREGIVLASNRADFRLLLAKDEHTDIDAILAKVGELIPMTEARRARLAADIDEAPRKAPVALFEDMSWEQFAAVNARAPELPGVSADMGEVRVYPFSAAFAHVIGYVAKVSAKDVTKTGPNADPILLNPGFRIGKQGVEKAFDLQLRGRPGARKVEVDVKGRVVRHDPSGDVAAAPGAPIRLTLDADVQNRAVEVFGDESGAAVMLDCRTGDVLCLFSAPSFDANLFVRGPTKPEYQALATYDHKPLFNKALTATYPPGSTFKTIVALAALKRGVDPATIHVCNRAWSWGGRVWHCDKAHGPLNMHDAIRQSCDIYFYQTALAVGPDRIAEMARAFGLGARFAIGIPGQKIGVVPDTAYKRRAFPRDPVWHGGETPSMGIGQGYLSVNALQLAVMSARLANGAVALEPRLIHAVGDQMTPSGARGPALGAEAAHLEFVREAMAAVVTSGTAAANGAADLGFGPVRMAGKTGTAQSHSYAGGHGAHGAQGAWALRDHAWFIAFAPADDPRYAMSVLVEHGGFGAEAAAPKAREIMRVALLKDPQVRDRIVQSPAPDKKVNSGESEAPAEGAEPPPPTPDSSSANPRPVLAT